MSEEPTNEELVAEGALHHATDWLQVWMVRAIMENDVATAELLLKAGMPTHHVKAMGPGNLTMMGLALKENLAIAKLLRKHRSMLTWKKNYPRHVPYGISNCLRKALNKGLLVEGAREWLLNPEACRVGSKPLDTYYHEYKATPPSWAQRNIVHISWPPANVSLEGCDNDLRHRIVFFWEAAGVIRRFEAKRNVDENWSILRTKWFKTRGIAMFWLGITQESGCKPEGVLCKRDREAYVEDFVS